MADLFDDSVEYEKAEKEVRPLSFGARIKTLGRFVLLNLRINMIIIADFFIWIWRLFVSKEMKNIENHVVLITGSGNGIGKQLALQFAREKCKVAVVDIDFDAACKTAEQIKSEFKVAAKAFKTDVSKYEEVEKLKIDVEESLGFVDILVNNAGILTTTISLLEGSHEDVKKIIDINLASHFWTIRVFMKGMIERKTGHIVAISSVLGKMSSPFTTTYSSTKFGICGLMDGLTTDLAIYGMDYIQTTTVYPFFVKTRKDLVEKVQVMGLPMIEADFLAKTVVSGVRRDERHIYVPSSVKLIANFVNMLPERASLHARLFPMMSQKRLQAITNFRMKNLSKSLNIADRQSENETQINSN